MSRTLPVSLETAQVRELMNANPRTRLIDVRTAAEFAAAHIPGSRNLPLGILRKHRAEFTPENDGPIVLLCASGARADEARAVLETAGLSQLSVLKGGVTGWEREGGPMNRGKGTWAMERQVRLVAGLFVLIGVVASMAYEPLKWIAGFVGAGLTFAALTNTCAMARVLSMLPHNRTRKPDVQNLLMALTDTEKAH